jgi:hypothetical protein
VVGGAASEVHSRDPRWVAVSPCEAGVQCRVMARPHRASEGSAVVSASADPRRVAVLAAPLSRGNWTSSHRRDRVLGARPSDPSWSVSPDLEGMAFCRDPKCGRVLTGVSEEYSVATHVGSRSHRHERRFCLATFGDPRRVAVLTPRGSIHSSGAHLGCVSPRERGFCGGDATGIRWIGRATCEVLSRDPSSVAVSPREVVVCAESWCGLTARAKALPWRCQWRSGGLVAPRAKCSVATQVGSRSHRAGEGSAAAVPVGARWVVAPRAKCTVTTQVGSRSHGVRRWFSVESWRGLTARARVLP